MNLAVSLVGVPKYTVEEVMPTGYTTAIADGISFEEYALQCARAFGALVEMRDEPASAPIPESFVPSTYHQRKLEQAHAELERVSALSEADIAQAAEADFQSTLTSHRARLKRAADLMAKYEEMLGKIRALEAPSPDHVEYKAFMESQILESIKFDCNTKHDVEPVREEPEQWLESTLSQLRDDLTYYEEHQRQEVERTHGRNQWVKALRESLRTKP